MLNFSLLLQPLLNQLTQAETHERPTLRQEHIFELQVEVLHEQRKIDRSSVGASGWSVIIGVSLSTWSFHPQLIGSRFVFRDFHCIT